MVLPPEVQAFILESRTGQRLGFVATVNADGTPNLAPKGTTTLYDEGHLVFLDIASPQTVANIERNPAVEVNMVDPIVRKGYRFRGTAAVHRHGPEFDAGIELLRSRGSSRGPADVNAVVVIAVDDVRPLVSPAYDAGATEASVGAGWMDHFREYYAAY